MTLLLKTRREGKTHSVIPQHGLNRLSLHHGVRTEILSHENPLSFGQDLFGQVPLVEAVRPLVRQGLQGGDQLLVEGAVVQDAVGRQAVKEVPGEIIQI